MQKSTLYKYFGKKLGSLLLTRMGVTGFWAGPVGVIFSFVFEKGLKHGVYKIDQLVLSEFNEKDRRAYLKLINTKDLDTEKKKDAYRKSFLKRLSEILSLKSL